MGVVVGDVAPVAETALNFSLYAHCGDRVPVMPGGATRAVYCEYDMRGRYVIVYVPVETYLTICEVQVFGERG